MKSFKYLLALPLALTSLVACGGKNYSKVSYESAVKVANSYLPSIKNHKASAIKINGHVNTIKIKGDATYWSYSKPLEDQEFKFDETLLTLIPNFTLKNSEVVVDSQDIADTSIPGSLMSMGESIFSKVTLYKFLLNAPKFPVNRNMIKAFYGFEKLEEDDDGFDWEKTKAKAWTKAEVAFSKNDSGLKITVDTKDLASFYAEVITAISGGKMNDNASAEPTELKYPLHAEITTNSIGYINSLSLKTKITKANYEFPQMPDILYFSLKGDLEADFILKFKQTFSKPLSVKYSLSVYDDAKTGEIPTIVWNNNNFAVTAKERPLKLNKSKSISATTSLDKFKDYVTFDWYKNIKNGAIATVYDDPIFNFNYWDRGFNIAFTNENYDVLAVPTYNSTNYEPKYNIVGAYGYDTTPYNQSFVTTSIDGRTISTDIGLPNNSQKLLEAAGDSLQSVSIKDSTGGYHPMYVDEIFVNSNMLNSNKSEIIINIAVAPYKA